jgi:hypothetical protein
LGCSSKHLDHNSVAISKDWIIEDARYVSNRLSDCFQLSPLRRSGMEDLRGHSRGNSTRFDEATKLSLGKVEQNNGNICMQEFLRAGWHLNAIDNMFSINEIRSCMGFSDFKDLER